MNALRTLAAALSVASLPLAVLAQSPAPTAPPAPCISAQDRQFDFWLGDWDVTDNASGRPVGTNDVTRELRGCVLQEHWAGAGARGGHGMSFNHYDAARKLWHQTWVDDSGGILYLDGGLRDGSMILSGKRIGRLGKPVTDRITYTPRPDGTVRQWWQVSRDDGKTWATSFDGIYHRK
ncbi:MAG TPA: hypothetical protein VE826_08115 [Dongiaceae bacterium]|nr:hypothetical protein [Dongiaceae bacterium]